MCGGLTEPTLLLRRSGCCCHFLVPTVPLRLRERRHPEISQGTLGGLGFGPSATLSPPSPSGPPLLEGDRSGEGELQLTAQGPVSTGCSEQARRGRPSAVRAVAGLSGPWTAGGPCPSHDKCDLWTAVGTDRRNPTSSRNTLRTKPSLETSMGKRSCQRRGLVLLAPCQLLGPVI